MSSEKQPCIRCNGEGQITCPGCDGTGKITQFNEDNKKGLTKIVSCAGCSGRGKRTCRVCGGAGKK